MPPLCPLVAVLRSPSVPHRAALTPSPSRGDAAWYPLPPRWRLPTVTTSLHLHRCDADDNEGNDVASSSLRSERQPPPRPPPPASTPRPPSSWGRASRPPRRRRTPAPPSVVGDPSAPPPPRPPPATSSSSSPAAIAAQERGTQFRPRHKHDPHGQGEEHDYCEEEVLPVGREHVRRHAQRQR